MINICRVCIFREISRCSQKERTAFPLAGVRLVNAILVHPVSVCYLSFVHNRLIVKASLCLWIYLQYTHKKKERKKKTLYNFTYVQGLVLLIMNKTDIEERT